VTSPGPATARASSACVHPRARPRGRAVRLSLCSDQSVAPERQRRLPPARSHQRPHQPQWPQAMQNRASGRALRRSRPMAPPHRSQRPQVPASIRARASSTSFSSRAVPSDGSCCCRASRRATSCRRASAIIPVPYPTWCRTRGIQAPFANREPNDVSARAAPAAPQVLPDGGIMDLRHAWVRGRPSGS